MTKLSIDALIFDCDGVLVDSEAIIHRVERKHLAEIGLHYPPEDFALKFAGLATTEFMREMADEYRRKFGTTLPDGFEERVNRAKHEALDNELVVVPDALNVVKAWKKPKAVASSSRLKPLIRKLDQMGLLEHFDGHVYSAESVHRGKPDPAIFLFAADELQATPDQCAVVEDSVLGVRAAKSAGMTAIGFTGGEHCGPQHEEALTDEGADLVVANFAELKRSLGI